MIGDLDASFSLSTYGFRKRIGDVVTRHLQATQHGTNIDQTSISDTANVHIATTSSSKEHAGSRRTCMRMPPAQSQDDFDIIDQTLLSTYERMETSFQLDFPWRKRRLQYRKHVSFPIEEKIKSYQEDVPRAAECHSTTAHVSDLWYRPHDFARFRCMAQLEASTIQWNQESCAFLELLEHSFSIVDRLADEVCKYRKRGHKEAALWDRIFQRLDIKETGLTQWCLLTEYRGLECLASKPMRHAKLDTRRSMKRETRRLESSCYASTSSHHPAGASKRRSLSADELAEKLQRRSQRSRLFARMIGVADEMALR